MNEAGILTTILLIGIVLGLVIRFLLGNISYHWAQIKEIMKNNKEFAKKKAEVAKMKANGDFHEWVSIPSTGGTMLVCKKTGYVPSLNGFVPVEMVKSYLNKVKREEEYKAFRDSRVKALADQYRMSLETAEKIVEAIFSIKKDFSVLQLTKLSEDLTQRAQDVSKNQL
jgi:phage FluMu protein gp41